MTMEGVEDEQGSCATAKADQYNLARRSDWTPRLYTDQSSVSSDPESEHGADVAVGSLVMVRPVDTNHVKSGDIVDIQLPQSVQTAYNYPTSIVHRISEVAGSADQRSFRVKGDNNNTPDPFIVRAQEIRGVVYAHIPYLGYPVLFVHSMQGVIFLGCTAALSALYAGLSYTERRKSRIAEVRSELTTGTVVPSDRVSSIERMSESVPLHVTLALEKFSSAMSEYALHLQSHTDAVQRLAASASDLETAARRQNDVLEQMLRLLDNPTERRAVDHLGKTSAADE